MNYKGLIIRGARATGGKAGKGRNITSTIQVIKPGSGYHLLFKQFRYKVGDRESLLKAVRKAFAYIDTIEAKKESSDE